MYIASRESTREEESAVPRVVENVSEPTVVGRGGEEPAVVNPGVSYCYGGRTEKEKRI